MKRLITTLILCLPLCLFAQGFGSFSHDQPYFAADKVAGPFDPNSITGLWLDLDASKNGPYLVSPNTDGSKMTNAPDWSPNHRGSTILDSSEVWIRWRQLNSGTYPTNTFFEWTNRLSRGHGIIGTNAASLAAPFTVMSVIQIKTADIESGHSFLFAGYGYTAPLNANVEIDTGPNVIRTWGGSYFEASQPWVDQKWLLVTAIYNTNNNSSSIRTNGVLCKAGSVNGGMTWQWSVGTMQYNYSQHFPGNMTRFLVWNRELNAGELANAETNLFNDYKLQN